MVCLAESGFIGRVEACIQQVLAFSDAFPLILRDYRAAGMKPFPYRLVYRVHEDTVQVFSLFHTSRDPLRLMERLDSTSDE